MAITAIKRIENRSSVTAKVRDLENSGVLGHNVPVLPGTDLEVDMWVPWSPAQGDFQGHHVAVDFASLVRFSVWQVNNADGDFVRFSTDHSWHYQGARVNGITEVGGDRTMVLFDDRFELTTHAPQVHGITDTLKLRHRASANLSIFDIENTNTPGHGVEVKPGDDLDCDMWIPWATNANEFTNHHLRIDIDRTPRFWIWQAARADGDWVRFSTDGSWHDPGVRVPGISDVSGHRGIIVKDSGIDFIRVQRSLAPAENGVDNVTVSRL